MPKTFRRFTNATAISLAMALIPGAAGVVAQERPLLIEGTQTLYQRVLTRPGATLRDEPGEEEGEALPAFQPLYVFMRQDGWSQVGHSASAAPVGWVDNTQVIEWNQNIVAAFTNPANRKRQFLFRTEEALRALMESEALRPMQDALIEKAASGLIAPEDNVVAAEPENFVNIQDELYIMPILDYVEDVHPLNYDDNLIMHVASAALHEELPMPEEPATTGEFDAGVVFVLDTTRSMGPYIGRTRDALEQIINDVRGTDVGDRINFGAIGFRDSVEAVPGLEYRTKVIVELARRDDQTPVLAAVQEATQVAEASSPGFNEDSLAGVEDAIEIDQWLSGSADPFDGRYIILVTDAGPNDVNDPLTRSRIGAAELQSMAREKGIVVMTLHLKTADGGQANHEYAAEQYRQLSRFDDGQYYYPIENGSEDAFEQTVTLLVTALTDHVRAALGEESVLSEEETGDDLVELGRAMRLAYLGAREGTRAPAVFDGWVSERAIEDPRALTIKPRLLITKNELATMAELTENIVRIGESTREQDDATAFFDQLQGVIATMAQNPDNLLAADAGTIGGALEYLERLPYRSPILAIDSRRWGESAMVRRGILDVLRQKLVLYRKWLFDQTVWTELYEGAPDGEWVFAMPFDVLP
ncbi:hypothetical protein ASD80_14465 [Devosia sp. Root635]|nr:hypothetical protein ASD80_14465 [Devosia sp. Root635]